MSRIAEQSSLPVVPLVLLLAGLLFGQANCSAFAQKTEKIKLNETFTLQTGEKVETEDARLKVQLKEVGRNISEGGEVEYVRLFVRTEKSARTITVSEKENSKIEIGDFIIELINAESFGKTNCELKISRKQ